MVAQQQIVETRVDLSAGGERGREKGKAFSVISLLKEAQTVPDERIYREPNPAPAARAHIIGRHPRQLG